MIRKKKKLYDRARKYGKPNDWSKFKTYKKDSHKAIKTAHTKYISDILDKSLQDKNPKPFWKYVKQMRKDSVGVAPQKSDIILPVSISYHLCIQIVKGIVNSWPCS